MDTLSSSVSTFNIPPSPRFQPISNQLHHFKNLLPHHSHLISSITKPKTSSKVSNKTTTNLTTHKNFIPPIFVNNTSQSQPASQFKQPSEFHKKASTGYAVALLDAARCCNVVEAVERDVKRLSKWLCNELLRDPCLEKEDKGEILKEIVRKGKFHKYLSKLINLLVQKTKVELLSQVLTEFTRIYDELTGCSSSPLVFASSGVKMEENQVLGIAKCVQKLTRVVDVGDGICIG